jgi:hypothetical protein
MRFWVVCLVMVSSISDSQPHYSVGLFYHRAGLAVQSFLLLYVEKYHIFLLRLIVAPLGVEKFRFLW